VDLPTDGNPTIPILASPDLETSNPSPTGPALDLEPSTNSLLSLASLAFNVPRWYDVALFFYVLAISCSISLIFCWVVAI